MIDTRAPQSADGIERILAASFLLVHASLLVVLDLFIALGSLLSGVVGLVAAQDHGLGSAAPLFGVSLVVGLGAAVLLGLASLEVFAGLLALKGRFRGLLSVSLLALASSLMLLPVGMFSCSFPGIILGLGMLVCSLLALAFAGQIPDEAPPVR